MNYYCIVMLEHPSFPVPGFRIICSAFCQRHRDEARRPTAFDTHENGVLVVGARGVDGFAHVTGTGDALSRDFENHVAFLEATFGGRTLWIDLCHNDAIFAGSSDGVGGRERQTELRHVG